jgi:hypothetical protein
MRSRLNIPAIAFFLAISLASSCLARADKIVLKNGRKIIASNVVEEGDRVRYETSAGQLTLPKSIIDHIEKSEFAGEMNGAAGAAEAMEMSAPAISAGSYDQIAHGVVRNGRIDRSYITQLENEARDGSGEANNRVAVAHHAAAQFELQHGDT